MSISLKSMRYFVTALSHGNISQAGAELNVAASAVGAAIDQIEAQFQLKLVQRRRAKGIAATASGKVLARRFSHLLEEYETTLREGAELKHSLSGELRIGYYAPVAPAFLPQILGDLSTAGDEVTYHIEECDNDRAQEGLLVGDFDVILFVSDTARPQLDYDRLIEAPAYCLVAADHAFASKETVTLRQIANTPVVLLNRPLARDYYQELFDAVGNKPNVVAYANSTEMVRSLVAAGQGCGVLNMQPAASRSYGDLPLVAVPIRDRLPTLTLSVGYMKTNPRRIVTHFVDQCQAYFSDGNGQCHIIAVQPK